MGLKSRIKNIVYNYNEDKKNKINLLNQISKDKKNVFIFGCPIHGNIGDHAILVAEKKILDDNFDVNVIEIESNFFLRNRNFVRKLVKNDLIFLTGGGFLGNLWLNEEKVFRKMISIFKKKSIIVFPHTIYFTNDNNGRKEKRVSQRIYRKCKDLTFYCREKYTYELLTKEFEKVKVKMAPDMVLYLNVLDKKSKIKNPKKVLFCMRKDKEKILSSSKKIENIVNNMGVNKIDFTDTVIEQNIYPKERMQLVMNKIYEFAEYDLVITDRLHGMIFAYLSNTPCLVFENKSYKIKGVSEWIKNQNIALCNNNNFENKLNEMSNKKNESVNKDKFKELINDIGMRLK